MLYYKAPVYLIFRYLHKGAVEETASVQKLYGEDDFANAIMIRQEEEEEKPPPSPLTRFKTDDISADLKQIAMKYAQTKPIFKEGKSLDLGRSKRRGEMKAEWEQKSDKLMQDQMPVWRDKFNESYTRRTSAGPRKVSLGSPSLERCQSTERKVSSSSNPIERCQLLSPNVAMKSQLLSPNVAMKSQLLSPNVAMKRSQSMTPTMVRRVTMERSSSLTPNMVRPVNMEKERRASSREERSTKCGEESQFSVESQSSEEMIHKWRVASSTVSIDLDKLCIKDVLPSIRTSECSSF